MTVAVRTVGIWKAFTGHEVLKGIDLEVSYDTEGEATLYLSQGRLSAWRRRSHERR